MAMTLKRVFSIRFLHKKPYNTTQRYVYNTYNLQNPKIMDTLLALPCKSTNIKFDFSYIRIYTVYYCNLPPAGACTLYMYLAGSQGDQAA